MKKLLAVKLRDLGDIALWTASLTALRRQYPHAEIHALVPRSAAALLEFHPAVDRLHTLANPRGAALAAALWRLRRERFDLALGFHATTSLCRFFPLAGARTRVLHHHSRTYTPGFSHLPIARPGALQNALERDFEVLRALGIPTEGVKPALALRERERTWATDQLAAYPTPLPRAAFLPGARTETRRYPRDTWLEVLAGVKRGGRWAPFVIADSDLARTWDLRPTCATLGVPLFDSVNLRELMALVDAADIALGNDSGPIHIAAALGRRTITIFGPGCFGDWHPYDLAEHRFVRAAVDCRAEGPRDREAFQYCTLTQCGHLSCLRRISPQAVGDELSKLSPRDSGA